jgi:hypothetical protein
MEFLSSSVSYRHHNLDTRVQSIYIARVNTDEKIEKMCAMCTLPVPSVAGPDPGSGAF